MPQKERSACRENPVKRKQDFPRDTHMPVVSGSERDKESAEVEEKNMKQAEGKIIIYLEKKEVCLLKVSCPPPPNS